MPIPTTWLQFNPTAVPSAAAGVGAGVQINQAELAREALARQAQQQAAQQALARQQLQQQAALQALNQLTEMQRMEIDREQFAANQGRLNEAFGLRREEQQREQEKEAIKSQAVLDLQRDLQDPNLKREDVLLKYLPILDPQGLSSLTGKLSVQPEVNLGQKIDIGIPGSYGIRTGTGSIQVVQDPTFEVPLTEEQKIRNKKLEVEYQKLLLDLNNPKTDPIEKLGITQKLKIISDGVTNEKNLKKQFGAIDNLVSEEKKKKTSQPVRITNDEQFDALPSGARFIGPDGVLRQKP